MADKMMMRRALHYVTAIKRRDAEYKEECAEWRRQGYRPHYCRHGVDMWTDYDNICGQCEDGYSTYELALMRAKSDVATFRQRMEWLNGISPHDMPSDLRSQIIDWACKPMMTD